MRKVKNDKFGFSFVGFLLFFATIAVTSTSAVVIYSLVEKKTNGDIGLAVLFVFLTILIGALLCTLSDILRRKMMVERPVKMILNATEKIASGDFSVKLPPLHEYDKYDQYDLIFNNINTMTAELSKNELLKNDFISNVSHEIKTPLAVLQNYAKILQKSNLSDKKRAEYLKGIELQTKKLSGLITNILKLNKLENQYIFKMTKF